MKLDLTKMKHIPGIGLFEQEAGDLHGNYRLTDSGITDEKSGWWYFFRKYEDKENPYVYRKIRKSPTDSNPDGDVDEEYVGLEFPFSVPSDWIAKLKRKATG